MNVSNLAGAADLGFAVFHLAFWRLFGWPRSLRASGVVNAAVTQTLNVVLTYVFAGYGAALFLAPASPWLLGAGAGFWLLRLGTQPTFFPMRNAPSLLISAVFAICCALHAVAALQAAG